MTRCSYCCVHQRHPPFRVDKSVSLTLYSPSKAANELIGGRSARAHPAPALSPTLESSGKDASLLLPGGAMLFRTETQESGLRRHVGIGERTCVSGRGLGICARKFCVLCIYRGYHRNCQRAPWPGAFSPALELNSVARLPLNIVEKETEPLAHRCAWRVAFNCGWTPGADEHHPRLQPAALM